ncbi:MAG: PAS domain-containing protein, partial [Chloroflexi bacterium]|nr:PAS domain-containing protein [Chloroflexota bacterium]
MIRSEVITLLPYLVSLGISLGLFLYLAGKRNAKGAFAFSWYLLAQALWLAGFVFGLASENLLSKILWSDLKWFASAIAIVALPVFAVQYAEQTVKRKKLLFGLILILPSLLVVCLVSDLFLGCLHKSPAINPLPHFSELTYELPPFIYAYVFYAYGIGIWSVSLLAGRVLRRQNLYRVQTLILAASIAIPVFGTLLPLLGIRVIATLDPTPLTSALGNLTLILGFARFRVFEVAPIGRDKVFEAMVDPVVILDNKNLVSDANNAMLNLLGKKPNEVIGRQAKEVFNGFPIPIKQYLQASYARAEANFTLRGVEVSYEMTVWPIYN